MPRVLHLYKDIFPPVYGGIEIVLSKLAVLQVQRGWDVSVAVSGPVDQNWCRSNGINGIQVGEWGRLLSNPISPGFIPILKQVKYDCLHVHMPCPTAVLAALLYANKTVPWFASYQSDIVRQRITGALYEPVQYRFLRRCAGIFVSSPALLMTSRTLRPVKDRCRIVPLGISREDPSNADLETARLIREEYGGKPLVLFVGRYRWYKGLPVLLDAMDRVDANLLVIGGGNSAQVRQLHRQIAGMKHPERIIILGSVPRLEPFLYASDLFCLPSTHRAEAFGYVILEAFRAGLPAITTELGTGTSYVNQHGVTGLVIPPGDPDVLADAIRTICNDTGLRAKFSTTARRIVQEDFGIERMVDLILDSYQHSCGLTSSNPVPDLT